jgi:hypothetical protein
VNDLDRLRQAALLSPPDLPGWLVYADALEEAGLADAAAFWRDVGLGNIWPLSHESGKTWTWFDVHDLVIHREPWAVPGRVFDRLRSPTVCLGYADYRSPRNALLALEAAWLADCREADA